MLLKLDRTELDLDDLIDPEDRLVQKLIQYIELKKNDSSMSDIEVGGACKACGSYINQDPTSFFSTIHNCEIWHFSILSDAELEDEEDYIDKDWKRIMGDDSDWTQEEIRIYRCCDCKKWYIDNDC
ncbi:hypothetical protein [Cytobacillus gottheilii]|uniref:DUF1963 domain-containing protein n=1 Tax=Cytobacillus gottheilii TaxID=859144 RepID=A0ABX8FJ04_9BACI|nr:hypothetical protein [Cytobacillus gottheilii]QVY63975.1 hypothetical protein J1899_22315 [Cytobacillus gottheilii]